MILLSDYFSSRTDEGQTKIVYTLAKKLKKKGATLVSFSNYEDDFSNIKLKINKAFFSTKLRKIIKNENVLFIPKGSYSLGSFLKIINMLVFCKPKTLTVMFVQFSKLNFIVKLFIKLLNINILVLSDKTYNIFKNCKNVVKVLIGVDTKTFIPVSNEIKDNLRKKYKLPTDENIILHVGHLSKGRNILPFSKLSYTKLLVVSSHTHKNEELKNEILSEDNVFFIDNFIENINEIYQLADCYVFLVENGNDCIDIPLSILEAMSTNLPIITTRYNDIATMKCESIEFVNVNIEEINLAIKKVIDKKSNTREIAENYDWDKSIEFIYSIVEGE